MTAAVPRTDPLGPVRRLSAWLRLSSLAAGALLLVFSAVAMATPGLLEAVVADETNAALPPGPLPPEKRYGLIAVWCVGLAACLWVLAGIATLFGHYRRGEIFTPGVADAIGRIGGRLLVLAGVGFFAHPAVSVLLSWDAAPGERMLAVSIDGATVLLALAGGLMIVIGRVTRIGAAIAAENDGFI